jgi:hypothetical protein
MTTSSKITQYNPLLSMNEQITPLAQAITTTTDLNAKLTIYRSVRDATTSFTIFPKTFAPAIAVIKKVGEQALIEKDLQTNLFNRVSNFVTDHPAFSLAVAGGIVAAVNSYPLWMGAAAGIGLYIAAKKIFSNNEIDRPQVEVPHFYDRPAFSLASASSYHSPSYYDLIDFKAPFPREQVASLGSYNSSLACSYVPTLAASRPSSFPSPASIGSAAYCSATNPTIPSAPPLSPRAAELTIEDDYFAAAPIIPQNQDLIVDGIRYNMNNFVKAVLDQGKLVRPLTRAPLKEDTITRICNYFNIKPKDFKNLFGPTSIPYEMAKQKENARMSHLGQLSQQDIEKSLEKNQTLFEKDERDERLTAFIELISSNEECFATQSFLKDLSR